MGHVVPTGIEQHGFGLGLAQHDVDQFVGTPISMSTHALRSLRALAVGVVAVSTVATPFGSVRVQKHTELELRFNDPSSGQLHPGVRETLRCGENTFVGYPGYADYRYIPVVGRGVTFQLPGSDDTWGMMCEADLEEVYRSRPLGYRLTRLYLLTAIPAGLAGWAIDHFAGLPAALSLPVFWIMQALGVLAFYHLGAKQLTGRVTSLIRAIRSIAEGGGDLRQRLDLDSRKPDELSTLASWFNSFIDKLEGTIRQVVHASHEIGIANQQLQGSRHDTRDSVMGVVERMAEMRPLLGQQQQQIDHASDSAASILQRMEALAQGSTQQVALIRERSQRLAPRRALVVGGVGLQPLGAQLRQRVGVHGLRHHVTVGHDGGGHESGGADHQHGRRDAPRSHPEPALHPPTPTSRETRAPVAPWAAV